MNEVCRNVAAEKIKEMPVERVMKLLIFMAGMEPSRAPDTLQSVHAPAAQGP